MKKFISNNKIKQSAFTYLLSVAFLLLMTTCLFSCKSQQLSYVSETSTVKNLSKQKIIQNVLDKELKYQTLTTKAKVNVGGKESAAILKIIKDSLIQISFRPKLGVEAARLDITPQRIVLINRINKKYIAISKNELQDIYILFNFYNLQSMLTNQLFLAGELNSDSSEYFRKLKMETFADSYLLHYQNKDKVFYNFTINANYKIKQIEIAKINANKKKDKNNFTIESIYRQFVEDEYQNIYPTQINIKLQCDDIRNNLNISYKYWEINKELSIDLKIPKNYKKIEELKTFISSFEK